MEDQNYCGECIYYVGEECQGQMHEGTEKYDDSEACEEFVTLLSTTGINP